jgi:tripartite-type tricarboxylate transporter receptor subunit TctC
MKLSRRRFLQLTAGAATLASSPRLSWGQSYPARPVRLVVGVPAGGQLDIIARLVGEWLSDRIGQPVIIENRPGAGTNIATEAVVRAPADGYTLLLASATAAINTTLYPKLKFEFIRDTVPIAGVNRIPLVLTVRSGFPASNVSELIDYAKSKPGKLNLATPSKGTGPYMAAQLFKMMTRIDAVLVPYRGDAQAMTDLMGGQVQAAFGGISAYVGNIQAGSVRALAVTTEEGVVKLPEVPPLGATVTGYEASGWCGIVAPKNTPTEIVDRLSNEISAALAHPKFLRRLAELGVSPLALSPATFARFIADETAKWAKVVEFAGLSRA